ncbi:MAG: type II secretion system F family protein [Acidobacteria bacterium]|nr:type II secretion system F family protein [Acidobacteriota bacterium]
MTLLLPLLAFVFASLSIAAVGARLLQHRYGLPALVNRRLQEVRVEPAPGSTTPSAQAVVKALKKVGSRVPRSPAEMGRLQLRMTQAGYRGPEALPIFYGLRVVLAIAAFLLFATPVLGRPDLVLALAALGVAYILPGMVIARLAKRRQHRIQLALADVLDLLVVCVEAGLGLDQAMVRVGQELEFAFPDLADELRIVNLELRAGKPRVEALKNLADRTGLDDVRSLVSMLVQTDRFGTSIAQSLRVHADTLRTKRRQRAEEAAAKTGVKMVFPLVFCIFPAIWVVTIAPAAIKFITVLMPMVKK